MRVAPKAAKSARRWFRRRVPFVPQMERTECGAACLASVLAWHGHHVALPEVRRACAVSRDGVGADGIVTAASQYGLQCRAFKIELDELPYVPTPAILHWSFNHFVVLESCSRHCATIVDPLSGRRRADAAELDRCFTGVVLILEPTGAFAKIPKSWPSMGRYRTAAASLRGGIVQILLASSALQVLGLMLPVASQVLLDRVLVPHRPDWLWPVGGVLAGALAATTALRFIRDWAAQTLQIALDQSLMNGFVQHLIRLPIAFFEQRDAGDLVHRVQSNAAIRDAFGRVGIAALLDGMLVLGSAALMLAYDPRLGVIVLGCAAVRLSLLLGLRQRTANAMAAELAAAAAETGALVEALSGVETTKASHAEAQVLQRWSGRLTTRMNHELVRRRLALDAGAAMLLLSSASTATVIYLGGREVIAQHITVGVFASFVMLVAMFMRPLESLLQAFGQLQYLGSHLRRLDDVFATVPERVEGDISPTERPFQTIRLSTVSFAYAKNLPPVLSDVSLSITRGERVAIVGPTGAGKSTLARIIVGLNEPTAGTVLVDDLPLEPRRVRQLRAGTGVVLQETFLFDDTISANICLGEDRPIDELREIARLAALDELVERLPRGFETVVGENGCRLSGGERQRLSLARALARNPVILLLDEATSALDLTTERRIHAALRTRDCTQIIIAHRLTSIRFADRIVVLDRGRIVQQGTFNELLARDGLFHRMIASVETVHA